MNTEIKKTEVEIMVDLRALIKDLDDVQRMKASGGKKSSLIKWDDLPSNQNRRQNSGLMIPTEDNAKERLKMLELYAKKD